MGVHCLLNSITNTTNQLKNPFRYCVRYKHNFVFSLYGCLYRTIRLHQSDRIMKIREQFNFIRLRMKSQLGHIFRTIISLRKILVLLNVSPDCPLLNSLRTTPYDVSCFHDSFCLSCDTWCSLEHFGAECSKSL